MKRVNILIVIRLEGKKAELSILQLQSRKGQQAYLFVPTEAVEKTRS